MERFNQHITSVTWVENLAASCHTCLCTNAAVHTRSLMELLQSYSFCPLSGSAHMNMDMNMKYPYLAQGFFLYNNPKQPYIFSFNKREAHTLNQSASYILDKCDGKTSIEEIIKKVVEDFAISPESARRDVQYTLEYAHGEGIINYSFKSLEKRSQSLGDHRSFIPIEAFVQVTYQCNFRCNYCFIKPERKDLHDVSDIFDLLFTWGTRKVILTGGEPLVRNDFMEIVTEAAKKFERVDVQTNGYFITDFEPDITSLPQTVAYYISLDGPQEYTDALHGKGTFERIIRGIKTLRQHGYKILLSVLLTPGNIMYYDYLRKLAEEVVDNKVNFGIPLPIGNSSDRIKAMYCDKEFILTYLEKVGKPLLDQSAEFSGRSANPAVTQCGAGVTSVTITPDGDIYPCATVCTDTQWKMGTIFDNDLERISQLISPHYATRPDQRCDKGIGYALQVFGSDFGGCFSIGQHLCKKGTLFTPPHV